MGRDPSSLDSHYVCVCTCVFVCARDSLPAILLQWRSRFLVAASSFLTSWGFLLLSSAQVVFSFLYRFQREPLFSPSLPPSLNPPFRTTSPRHSSPFTIHIPLFFITLSHPRIRDRLRVSFSFSTDMPSSVFVGGDALNTRHRNQCHPGGYFRVSSSHDKTLLR